MHQLLYHFHVFDGDTRLGDEEHAQEIVRWTIFGPTGLRAFRVALFSMLVDQAEGVSTVKVALHWAWTKMAIASVLTFMLLMIMLFRLLIVNGMDQDNNNNNNNNNNKQHREHQHQEHHGFSNLQHSSTLSLTTTANHATSKKRRQELYPKGQSIQLMPKRRSDGFSASNTRSSSQQSSTRRIPESFNNKLKSTTVFSAWDSYQPWMWVWLPVVSFALL